MEREVPSSALIGDWLVESIGDEPVDPGAPRSVRFVEGQVSGKVGVNRFTGSYTHGGDSLEVGALRSTRMAGPPELMELESRFNSQVPGEHRVELSDDVLVLSQGDSSIRLTREPQLSLDGDWLVASIEDEPVDPQAPRAIRFEEGMISGQVGVNRFTGSYTLGGEVLAIGQGRMTLMAGPPESMEPENRFASHLFGEHRIRMEGDSLVLSGEEGSIRLTRARALSVQGTVGYRERIRLLPGSVVTVELIDISVADIADEPIASQMIAGTASPPIPFTLTSNEDTNEEQRLAVRARIVSEEGDLLWVTDTPAIVTTPDEPIDLLLRRV